ncbi:MAG: hypothetical protein AB7O37_00120 [Vicinamibacteria bacterium]
MAVCLLLGAAFARDAVAQQPPAASAERPVALRLREGETTLDLRVVGLVREAESVSFRPVTAAGGVGRERSVPLALVIAPAVADIPQRLRLREGERTLELRVTGLAREGEAVRFRPLTASGGTGREQGPIPLALVTSPRVEEIPFLLRLREGGRTADLRVFDLAREGDSVRFRPMLPSGQPGQGRTIPLALVVAPDPAALPTATTAVAEAPATPAQVRRAPVALPPPAAGQPVPPAAAPLAAGDVLEDRWDVFEALFAELKLDEPTLKAVRIVPSGKDPYNQNTLKGDKPIAGDDLFFVLTASLDAVSELRRVPLPSGISAAQPGRPEFFGDGDLASSSPRATLSFELFKGQTSFRPKTWALKLTGAGNLNYLRANEQNVVNVDPREGRTRTKTRFSLEEAFGELKLLDLSPRYDTLSARVGIQPFVSDFRGFVFSDFNLGARLFGNAGGNRWQYNAAFFDLLEKETNSELNSFEKREQKVLVANLYRQDFLALGHTLELSYHRSQDEASHEPHFDSNDFLVRPARIGTPRLHDVTTNYVGLAGDGHLGRTNTSYAAYYVFGEDEDHPLAGPQDVRAAMAALELSVDRDWARFRASGFFASGDGDVYDERAGGFDSIYDTSNFAGGPFSFWSRSAIPLTQTAVLLKAPGSLLPNLRTNKFEGQANHVNPGLLLANLGLDLELTPKLKAILNASYLRFHKTQSLETLLFQPGIRQPIGWDLGAGVLWRPDLSENVVISAGLTALLPSASFDDLFSSPCGAARCATSTPRLYNAFLQIKLTY